MLRNKITPKQSPAPKQPVDPMLPRILKRNRGSLVGLICAINKNDDANFFKYLEDLKKIHKKNAEELIELANYGIPGDTEITKFLTNIASGVKFTVVGLACIWGRVNYVKELIAAGASVNVNSVEYANPLYIAISEGNEELVDVLLNANADPNFINLKGDATLHAAVDSIKFASSEIKFRVIRKLLQIPTLQIDIVSTKDLRTSLMLAADFQEYAICRLLLAHGADVNYQDSAGDTVLNHLLDQRITLTKEESPSDEKLEKLRELITLCLEKGAKVNLLNKQLQNSCDYLMLTQDTFIYKQVLEKSQDPKNRIFFLVALIQAENPVAMIATKNEVILRFPELNIEVNLNDLNKLEKDILLFFSAQLPKEIDTTIMEVLLNSGANPNFKMKTSILTNQGEKKLDFDLEEYVTREVNNENEKQHEREINVKKKNRRKGRKNQRDEKKTIESKRTTTDDDEEDAKTIGMSVLYYGFMMNKEDFCRQLLKQGADVNQGLGTDTPILYATRVESILFVQLLLYFNADFSLPGPGKYKEFFTKRLTPLLAAIELGNLPLLELLLTAYKDKKMLHLLDFNTAEIKNALQIAIISKRPDIVRALLRMGANPLVTLFYDNQNGYLPQYLSELPAVLKLSFCPLYLSIRDVKIFLVILEEYENKIFCEGYLDEIIIKQEKLLSIYWGVIKYSFDVEDKKNDKLLFLISLRRIFDACLILLSSMDTQEHMRAYMGLRERIIAKFGFDIVKVQSAPIKKYFNNLMKLKVYGQKFKREHQKINAHHKAKEKEREIEGLSIEKSAKFPSETESKLASVNAVIWLLDYFYHSTKDEGIYFFHQCEVYLSLCYFHDEKEYAIQILDRYNLPRKIPLHDQPKFTIDDWLKNKNIKCTTTNINDVFSLVTIEKQSNNMSSHRYFQLEGYSSSEIKEMYKEIERKSDELAAEKLARIGVFNTAATQGKNSECDWFAGVLQFNSEGVRLVENAVTPTYLWIPQGLFDEMVENNFMSKRVKFDQKHLGGIEDEELKSITRTIIISGVSYICRLRYEMKDKSSEQRLYIFQLGNLLIALEYGLSIHNAAAKKEFLNSSHDDIVLDKYLPQSFSSTSGKFKNG